MLNKNRNAVLLVLLGIVVLAWVWTEYNGKKESNYRTVLATFDTAAVDHISISPADGKPAFTMDKEAGGWKINLPGKTFTANEKSVKSTLDMINGLKVIRMASNNADKQAQFGLDAGKRTLVEVGEGNNTLATIALGRFDYIMPENAQPDAYGRQPQGEMIFYAGIPGEPATYVIDGQVGFSIGKEHDYFRSKTLVDVDKDKITSIAVQQEGMPDHHFALSGSQWTFDDLPADSSKAAQYLQRMSKQNGSKFDNEANVSALPQVALITLQGNDFEDVLIRAYRKDTADLIVTSSVNPEGAFLDKGGNLLKKMVVTSDFFRPAQK